jgi:hypothetical protein
MWCDELEVLAQGLYNKKCQDTGVSPALDKAAKNYLKAIRLNNLYHQLHLADQNLGLHAVAVVALIIHRASMHELKGRLEESEAIAHEKVDPVFQDYYDNSDSDSAADRECNSNRNRTNRNKTNENHSHFAFNQNVDAASSDSTIKSANMKSLLYVQDDSDDVAGEESLEDTSSATNSNNKADRTSDDTVDSTVTDDSEEFDDTNNVTVPRVSLQNTESSTSGNTADGVEIHVENSSHVNGFNQTKGDVPLHTIVKQIVERNRLKDNRRKLRIAANANCESTQSKYARELREKEREIRRHHRQLRNYARSMKKLEILRSKRHKLLSKQRKQVEDEEMSRILSFVSPTVDSQTQIGNNNGSRRAIGNADRRLHCLPSIGFTSFDFSGNTLTNDSIAILAPALKSADTLQCLNLSGTLISGDGMKSIIDSILHHPSIATFICGGTISRPVRLGYEVCQCLRTYLNENEQLTELDLSNGGIGMMSNAINLLADGIVFNNRLTKLNLSHNMLGFYDIIVLCVGMLAQTCKLDSARKIVTKNIINQCKTTLQEASAKDAGVCASKNAQKISSTMNESVNNAIQISSENDSSSDDEDEDSEQEDLPEWDILPEFEKKQLRVERQLRNRIAKEEKKRREAELGLKKVRKRRNYYKLFLEIQSLTKLSGKLILQELFMLTLSQYINMITLASHSSDKSADVVAADASMKHSTMMADSSSFILSSDDILAFDKDETDHSYVDLGNTQIHMPYFLNPIVDEHDLFLCISSMFANFAF